MKKRLLWLAFLILAAPATAQTLDERVMERQNRVCDQSPCVAADPAPQPEPTGVPQAIAAMVPGSWLHYGAPWDEAAPEVRPCGKRFSAIFSAWNGWARDGLRYIYVAASGGHGDGCDNGVYRYDIQTGRAENIVPHVELNTDTGLNPETGKRHAYPYVANEDGIQVLPRSSHTYTGQYFDAPWLYLTPGAEYRHGGSTGQVWRFHVEELRWERLPDRFDENGERIARGRSLMVKTPDGPVLMGGRNICDADLVAGRYDCQHAFSFTVSSGLAWDPVLGGIWHVDPKHRYVRFLRRVDGVWQLDNSLSGAIPDHIRAGMASLPGICVVPDQGILVWSNSADLYRWDGAVWSVVSAPGGPPIGYKRRVATKWSWDDEAKVCIGGSTTAEGLWIYKPGQIAGNPTLPPVPEPEPDPVPEPEPEPEPTPTAGVDMAAKWSIDRDNLPSIGGVEIAVGDWTPTPWDQRIERLPGAPDYDAICEGPWAELHYRTNADLAGSEDEAEKLLRAGTPNVRIFLYPLKNAAGDVVAYTGGIRTENSNCLEVIGMLDEGRKPQISGNISFRVGRGLIIRSVIIVEAGARCPGIRSKMEDMINFVVLHDSEFYGCGGHTHFFGVSRRDVASTYLEQIGNVTAYAKSHAQYNERSVGRFVYKSNICFAGGWGHCLKNLAHSSLIEGNVFANAGLDGQVIISPNGAALGVRTYRGGMHPLDLYGCTQTVVRGNTFVYRTTNNVRNVIAYRPRGSWGGCNKGRRLAEDRWELLRPTDPAYQDPAFWADVAAARPLFDEGFEAARASDLLFTHQADGNRFIVLLAFKPDIVGIGRVSAARLVSLRPIGKGRYNPVVAALKTESAALVVTCEQEAECYYAGASDDLKYAYDHLPDKWKKIMVRRGKLPAKVPIQEPENWAERVAVFWGSQEGWACDAEGVSCEPWDVPAPHVPVEDWGFDPVRQASPPRVIVVE